MSGYNMYDRSFIGAQTSSTSTSTTKPIKLNSDLITRTISFHGLPLQKIWEGERGGSDLAQNGLTNPDYSVYQLRQRYLTFQDRAKRLKLHQFMSKKATELFDDRLVDTNPSRLAMKLNGRGKKIIALLRGKIYR